MKRTANSRGLSSGCSSARVKAIVSTGDVKWRLDAGIVPGWVRMNGRTLGGAGSGATELASATAAAAFAYLWNSQLERRSRNALRGVLWIHGPDAEPGNLC